MFTLNQNLDPVGTSLAVSLPDVSIEQMTAAFGPPAETSWVEKEKGYTGDEWYFEDDNGKVFTVYARYDELRVGTENPTKSDVLPFVNFLLESV